MQTTAIRPQHSTPAIVFKGSAAPARRSGAIGLPQHFAKGDELFAEGDEADYFYKVVSGSVRSYKLLSDGRRQIDAFHLPGDIFGLEADSDHRFTAEAVEATSVIAFRRSRLVELTADDPAFGEQVMMSMMRSLERAQDHMLLLGRKTAQEKLASFLLEMAARLSQEDGHVVLPMQRADIADHLGLTIETVSRTLTQLARNHLIGLRSGSRDVDLCDIKGLRHLQGC